MTDLSQVKAGEYELVAHSWDQPTSKPGEPYDFIAHRKGAKVTLNIEEARRLVSAGAVKPITGSTGKAPAADPGQGKADTIPVIMDRVGDDPDQAIAELVAEQERGDAARPSLLDKLQAVIDAADSSDDPEDDDLDEDED